MAGAAVEPDSHDGFPNFRQTGPLQDGWVTIFPTAMNPVFRGRPQAEQILATLAHLQRNRDSRDEENGAARHDPVLAGHSVDSSMLIWSRSCSCSIPAAADASASAVAAMRSSMSL